MKHLKQKLLLTALLLLAVVNVNADNFTVNGITYTTNDDGVTCYVASALSSITNAIIPDEVLYEEKEYTVTSIGDNAFYNCYRLSNVTIGNNVTSIGNYAFSGCTGLISIDFPGSVTSIGERAFNNCKSLASIVIPNSTTSIGNYAFTYCEKLVSVAIRSCMESISTGTFEHCTSLTTIELPNSITSIGKRAFYNCSSLPSIDIPTSVTSIGDYAFSSCSSLPSIDIPTSVTSIGDYAFSYCRGLITIELPNSITSIGSRAFSDCSNLTSIDIPNSVTSIGNNAFSGCRALSKANFASIESLCSIDFIGNSFGDYTNPLSITKHLYINGVEITDLVIPDNITSIGNYAFYGCSGLLSVSIPSSMTSIGSFAFYNCSGLTKANFASVENLCSIDFINYASNPLSVAKHLYINDMEITDLIIPDDVKSIGNSAFYGCSGLSSVTIPSSVTSIGNIAFYKCSGLSSVTIPSSVTSIGESAFYNCSGLQSATILGGGMTIGKDAFYYCPLKKAEFASIEDLCSVKFVNFRSNPVSISHNLYINGEEVTELEIPNTVTSIGDYALYSCKGLTSVTVGNNTKSIGNQSFYECENLVNVNLGNNVETIGERTFWNCTSLTSITIPRSVTYLGNYAFNNCSELKSVEIKSSELTLGYSETFGPQIFSDCSKISEFTILCSEPPYMNNHYNLFQNVPISSATLYVPENRVGYYRNTLPWSGFGQILPYQATKIELTDATPVSYITDNYYDELDYTRTFNNTNWQALYVPFSMQYEDWAEDFEVARLNNVNQYDDDNDGTVDRTVLEVIKLAEGSKTEANTPYMIKAKETGEKTITVADATLYKTEETSHDVTSWETKFTFTGTYHTVTDMATNGYYALAGGRLQQATSDAVTLSPMRWYLSVTDRNGNPQGLAKSISVVIDGGETTGISEVNTITTRSNAIYSINGSYIGTDRSKLTKGIYVSGGKKIIIK